MAVEGMTQLVMLVFKRLLLYEGTAIGFKSARIQIKNETTCPGFGTQITNMRTKLVYKESISLH